MSVLQNGCMLREKGNNMLILKRYYSAKPSQERGLSGIPMHEVRFSIIGEQDRLLPVSP